MRLDAFPERTLNGEVKFVATVASQQDWSSADVKVYQTLVSIKESVPGLKPGMSAEVTIFTDSAREECLAIPVQAIYGTLDMGNKRNVKVLLPDGTTETREIVVGLSNDKMAEIESGLEEGETFEEAGVRVRDVRYIASQPWPFPSSLMIAAIGVADSDALAIDPNELEDAIWVSRDEVRAVMAGEPGPFVAPPPYAIAFNLLSAWIEGG